MRHRNILATKFCISQNRVASKGSDISTLYTIKISLNYISQHTIKPPPNVFRPKNTRPFPFRHLVSLLFLVFPSQPLEIFFLPISLSHYLASRPAYYQTVHQNLLWTFYSCYLALRAQSVGWFLILRVGLNVRSLCWAVQQTVGEQSVDHWGCCLVAHLVYMLVEEGLGEMVPLMTVLEDSLKMELSERQVVLENCWKILHTHHAHSPIQHFSQSLAKSSPSVSAQHDCLEV